MNIEESTIEQRRTVQAIMLEAWSAAERECPGAGWPSLKAAIDALPELSDAVYACNRLFIEVVEKKLTEHFPADAKE